MDFTGGDRPVVVLTEAGRAVMKAERPVRLLLPPLTERRRAAPAAERAGRRPPADRGEAMPPAAAGMFEALRAHRLALAREQGVPPYVIASDRTLREMAVQQPRTRGELMDVYGIGVAKADRFGRGFLDVIARAPRLHCRRHEDRRPPAGRAPRERRAAVRGGRPPAHRLRRATCCGAPSGTGIGDPASARAVIEGIGLLAIALVALEITQTVVEEEIVREANISAPTRVRRYLSRFLAVVVVALSIETLVATFELQHENPAGLPYAASIGFAAAALLAGVGRLRPAESQRRGHRARRDAEGQGRGRQGRIGGGVRLRAAVRRRVAVHGRGEGPRRRGCASTRPGRASRYTRAHLPVVLVWSRACETWGDALREEHRIKQLTRAEKEALIRETGR